MMSDYAAEKLGRANLGVPLWLLRLEKKTDILEKAGFGTIAGLVEGLKTGALFRIPGVGFKTIREARDKLVLLAGHVDNGDGSICWQGYHEACGLVAVPAGEIGSGSEFLAAFPEVIEAIIHYQDNPVDRLILTERLVRQPDERMTLDEIGASAPITITRERVRQRQEVLLHGLSAALLYGDYRELRFCFRDSFTRHWKDAAQLFADAKEIPFSAFMAGLEQAWRVSAAELFPHLPLITSILRA